MLFTSFLSSFQWKYQQHQDAGNMKTEIAGAKKQTEIINQLNSDHSYRYTLHVRYENINISFKRSKLRGKSEIKSSSHYFGLHQGIK